MCGSLTSILRIRTVRHKLVGHIWIGLSFHISLIVLTQTQSTTYGYISGGTEGATIDLVDFLREYGENCLETAGAVGP